MRLYEHYITDLSFSFLAKCLKSLFMFVSISHLCLISIYSLHQTVFANDTSDLCFNKLRGYFQTYFYLTSVLVCQDCHNEISQTGWLKQQKSIFSQFYRLEVMESAGLVSSEASLLGLQITIFLLCLPPFLCGCTSLVSLFTFPLVRTPVRSDQDLDNNIITPTVDPVLKYSHVLRCAGGQSFNTGTSGEHNSTQNNLLAAFSIVENSFKSFGILFCSLFYRLLFFLVI